MEMVVLVGSAVKGGKAVQLCGPATVVVWPASTASLVPLGPKVVRGVTDRPGPGLRP